MGVHGLTTYLREHKRSLSATIQLGSRSTGSHIPIVVDGWSFIYAVSTSSGLPWVYGGEYPEFEKTAKAVVEAWIQVGLTIHFVFDGPYPDLKFSTLVTRLGQSHVQAGLLFFRTSHASRSTARSLAETWMLPPLTYTTCLHMLKELQSTTDSLHIHFADEEGDPYAVELAGRIGGYVVGNDSDFVILNSEGYLGYISIDEMVWQTPSLDEDATVDQDDSEFQIVRKPKSSRKHTIPAGVLPPEHGDLTLHLTVYSPSSLAKHLNLPVTLLPLLGALVGNDFSAQSETHRRRLQNLFFERQLSMTQRIEHAASVVRSILSPNAPSRRKSKQEVGSVMDLMDRTVNALLTRHVSSLGSGEIDTIINGVVEATLQYAIPRSDPKDSPLWPTKICALHAPDTCPLLPTVSRRLLEQLETMDEEDQALLQAREIIIDAYRRGSLSPKIMDPLHTSSSWPRAFLEHPDVESVNRSIARPIREWVYSILDDIVGLPDPPLPVKDDVESTQPDGESDVEEEEDDDEIIDVVEENSDEDDIDFLAPLKGELHRLHGSEDEGAEASAPSITSSHPRERPRPPVIAEYVRRGTRVVPEDVMAPPLQTLFQSIGLEDFGKEESPLLLLRPKEDRFTVLLRLLKSDTHSIRALPPLHLAPALALRWTAIKLSERAQESGSKDRDKERWTTREAQSWLAVFKVQDAETEFKPVEITDRNVQLMAQMLAVMENIDQLAQVLLLEQRVPSTAHLLSGKRFHSLLNDEDFVLGEEVDNVWHAVSDDLEDVFQEPKPKRAKKAKKGAQQGSTTTKPQARRPAQGFFTILNSDMM